MSENNDNKIDPNNAADESIRGKLNRETARIAWLELEKHFAAGNLVFVSPELDLIDVACQVADDNKAVIEGWMADALVGAASDVQAAHWQSTGAELWAVVVAPLVLVQPLRQ